MAQLGSTGQKKRGEKRQQTKPSSSGPANLVSGEICRERKRGNVSHQWGMPPAAAAAARPAVFWSGCYLERQQLSIGSCL